MLPYLHSLGFTDKESDIIVCLFRYGAQAASSIAKHAKIERTNTYKILLQLVEK
jgi:sugar-specific transcriptional regulator TrmB